MKHANGQFAHPRVFYVFRVVKDVFSLFYCIFLGAFFKLYALR